MPKQETLTFAFDVGTGSLGCAVRLGDKIVRTETYLFDPEFASTKRASDKRRLSRTRLAHRAREYLLNQLCVEAGIPVLKKIEIKKGDYRVTEIDPRLKREFPASGDKTVYTSCLLRIMLLEGSELEAWQIYKALHSAIQRRGYGRVPWATGKKQEPDDQKAKPDDDEAANTERAARFNRELDSISENGRHHFISYFIAHRMGLWTPEKGIVKTRVDLSAKRASLLEGVGYQGITASRDTVENELKLLLEAAKRKFPKLDVNSALHGIHGKKLESVKELSDANRTLYSRTWQGLLGQKVPRFDNRILASCALIRRMHVARTDYGKNPLHSELHLLLALHRLRPMEIASHRSRPLKPEELRQIYDTHVNGKTRGEHPTFKFTPTQLEKALRPFGLVAAPAANEIPAPKNSGRSRFSRPGAYLLKKLILSGKNPRNFLKETLTQPCAPGSKITIQDNLDPMKGLVGHDLKWLELLKDQSWEGIHVSDVGAASGATIKDILKDLRNPVVRHRIEFFGQTLRSLCEWSDKNLGRTKPDRVALELVREKLNDRQKSERDKFNKSRQKERDQIRKEVTRGEGGTKLRKAMLAKAQGYRNLFPESGSKLQEGENISQDLDHYDIEHIIPQTKGGPDTFWNTVLCLSRINREKGDKTPMDWLKNDPDRLALFKKRVAAAKDLHSMTRQLLLLPLEEGLERVDKYTQLAGTAWIARLARRVIFSTLDWPENQENGQKVLFVNGGLTAKLRRKYGLNRELNPDLEDKKNRESPLHHALDACVVSFVENLVNPEIPQKGLTSIKKMLWNGKLVNAGPRASLLEENFYGKRTVRLEKESVEDSFEATIWRVPLFELAMKSENMKPVFKIDELEKNIKRIYPTAIMEPELKSRGELLKILENLRLSKTPEEDWRKWCEKQLATGKTPRRVALYERIKSEFSEVKEVQLQEKGRPQLLKPKGTHVGQFVLKGKDAKGNIKITVRPVYVHEARSSVEAEIKTKGSEIVFFVRSGDYVVLPEGTEDMKIEPGTYRLNSLWSTGVVVLQDLLGRSVSYKPSIGKLVALGFKPVSDSD